MTRQIFLKLNTILEPAMAGAGKKHKICKFQFTTLVCTRWSKMAKGGFPLFAETTRSEFASTHWLAEQFPVIVWVWQFNEHRPSWFFKKRQLNQAITITLQLTEHANILLNTYPVVVFSDFSLQPLIPCTRSQQCFTTAMIPSGSAILNISNCHVVVLWCGITRCE